MYMNLQELRYFFIHYTPFTMAACNALARLYYETGETPTQDVWLEWDEYTMPQKGSIPAHAIPLGDTYLIRHRRQNRFAIMATQSESVSQPI